MPASLDSLNLEGAKSEELRALIASIAESTSADGLPRYGRRVIRALTRVIVCRTYAKMTLELSHLIAAICDRQGRYEHILWGVDRAQARLFKASLGECGWLRRNVEVGATGIVHCIEEERFQITYTRMPVLTAFVEFIISALGYDVVDQLTAPVRVGNASPTDVTGVANALQRGLYGFLKDHLPPAHRQRRERHFLDFVETNAGNRNGADAITDDVVLEYWVSHATEPGFDNKTYRSVYEMSVRSIIALDAAAERVQGGYAASIGTDREAGEVDPADVEAVVAALESDENPLSRVLEESGDTIKVLTATEAEVLRTLPMSHAVERRVPVSVIRNAVQGAVQLKLSSAMRSGTSVLGSGRPIETEAYANQLCAYADIANVLDKILYASLWILFAARDDAAISLALELAPDINWGSLFEEKAQENVGNVQSLNVHRAMALFFDTVPDRRGDEVQALLAEARNAYRGINRKGFTEPRDPGVVPALAAAVNEIVSLIKAIRRYTDDEAARVDWDTVGRSDQQVFEAMFLKLYADIEIAGA